MCDDPTDPRRKLVIEASEDLFIPMSMKVSTCGLIKHIPTYYELHDCQCILLPDEFYWDPAKNLFKISSTEEEYWTRSNFRHCINIAESRIPIASPNIQCRYELGTHDFDREMPNFSIGISQDLMVDRSIRNVRVRIIRSKYYNYTDKLHHGIITYLLVSKWGILLDKENHTLQSTIKDNVRSSLKPLIRWYRTDFL